MLLKGNCLETLKTLETASVDSIVTDPPYELGFMGKSWDNSGIAYSTDLWAECLRVLKPGGHLLAFGGSRTYHRMVVAIEDSGFEIRDQIAWIYSSGFPKSKNVALAIDKGEGHPNRGKAIPTASKYQTSDLEETNKLTSNPVPPYEAKSEVAQQWEGWGTALKPAHEPIVVARRPLIGTVANNVLTYGTGALNIDGSRVGTEIVTINTFDNGAKPFGGAIGEPFSSRQQQGRWPANVIHDDLEEEWSRFFYCAKANKKERNAGTDGANNHPTVKPLKLMRYLVKLVTPPGGIVLDPFLGSGTTAMAAVMEGFDWVGCEMTEEYWPIIEARIEWAKTEAKKSPITLF
jgi:DNA modification methylase